MNIKEIAELAGVSRATVSRYFNDGYVSEEKREKIRAVVEEKGYTPSAQASALRTKKTKLIGVILPKINSDAISRVVAGVNSVLYREGYQIILADTENQEKREVEYLRLFDQNRVDGIILIATIFTSEHRKALQELTVPVVLVGQYLHGYSCVYHDDYGASYALTKCLIEGGSKRIGFIGATNKDVAAGLMRKKGFLAAMKEAGLPAPETVIKETSFSMEGGYEMAKELAGANDLDGIVCATDSMALGAERYLKEIGKRVPEDVQLAGVGDSKMGQVTTPSLTTAHLYYKTSGQEAARILLEALEKEEAPAREIKMAYTLKQKGSTRQSQ